MMDIYFPWWAMILSFVSGIVACIAVSMLKNRFGGRRGHCEDVGQAAALTSKEQAALNGQPIEVDAMEAGLEIEPGTAGASILDDDDIMVEVDDRGHERPL